MNDILIVSNWLGYKNLPNGGCKVKNYMNGGTVSVLSPEEYDLLKKIKNNTLEINEISGDKWVKERLEKFAELDLVRLRNVLCKDGTYTYHTIHSFHKQKMKGLPRVCIWLANMTTLFGAPLSLLYVLYCLHIHHMGIAVLNNCISLPTLLICGVLGIACHELGHAMAALSYGSRVFEFGISMRWGILFGGAYVMTDAEHVCGRVERVQVDMAGVEMNLILAAVFMRLGLVMPELCALGVCGSVANLTYAAFNTLSKGTDGMSAFEEILHDHHIEISIRRALSVFVPWNGKKKNRFRNAGHFITCFSVGVTRLFPIAYVGWMLTVIFHIQLRSELFLDMLDCLKTTWEYVMIGIAFATMAIMLGMLAWLIINMLKVNHGNIKPC